MNDIEILWSSLQQYLASLYTIGLWVELTLLVFFALLSILIKKYWTKKFMMDDEKIIQRRNLTLNSINRTIFPLSMMIMVLLARTVMHSIFKIETPFLNIAVPLLFSMGLIRLIVYMLRKGFSPGPRVKAMENIIVTTIWLGVALHLLGWLGPMLQHMDSLAFTLGETRFSLWSVLKLIFSLAVLMIVALWISRNIETKLKKNIHLDPGMRVGLAKIIHFLLIITAGLITLNIVGINLTALHVFSGALGVGLGFGLQKIASNFVSGFILIFDRSIKPGDVISIDETIGWIQEMRARYVVMKNREGVDTLIPNESLITSQVINWSYEDPNVRLKIPVQVSYENDPEQAMDLMLSVAKKTPRVLSKPAPAARLMSFGDSGIDLELRIWITDPQQGVANVRSQINVGIWRIFKEYGITIPYPQRDIYLKNMPAKAFETDA
ncbi:MAG: mechanosensitive ion channel [Desulfonatronovibrio sp.]